MVQWLELLLVKQEELGSIPAQNQMVNLLSPWGGGRKKWIESRHAKLHNLEDPCRYKIIPSSAIKEQTTVSARYKSKKMHQINLKQQISE